MNTLISIVHAIGTKPLTVSLVAQAIVIALAIRSKDKEKLTQGLILMVGLILAVVSIALRPPSPVMLLPDVLGSVAGLVFFAPAVQSLLKLRKPSQDGEPG